MWANKTAARICEWQKWVGDAGNGARSPVLLPVLDTVECPVDAYTLAILEGGVDLRGAKKPKRGGGGEDEYDIHSANGNTG